ncbi:Protein QUIRKY [Vitis vinifera]|uniref:Protein QUIRKY n=1 Tax=Vitis vinifera TaxID=29760 RepID=A0A438DSM4_VITVI|nr:Protein QUIRKY [Vitis vinifera]
MATIRKLIVEVVDGRNLSPKDGQGTSSPYAIVDFCGQRKRTKTVVRDLNPTWNEVLEFNVASGALELFGDTIEVDVLHDRSYGHTRRNNCLGRIRLSSRQFVKKVPSQPPVLEEVKPPEAVPPPAADSGTTDAPAAPPPKTEAVPPAEPEASDPPKSSEEQPPAPPPVEAPPAEEPAPSSENPTPEAEKQPESEPPPPPQEGTQDKMEACPPDVEQSNAETEAPVPKWVPSPQVMASIENRSAPQVKFAPFEPVHRPLSSGNFKADLRGNPVVTIAVSGSHVSSKPALKSTSFFEWDQTFAFGRETPESTSLLEVSVWDPQRSNPSDVAGDGFLGGICFDVAEIPLRDPPDSPLAPQWYRIEGGAADNGVLMLATWIGTQADESFPEAWITDAAGSVHSKSKVYQSPKLWYLRITVMEAQDVLPLTSLKDLSLQLTVKLGFQIQKTKVSVTRNGTPLWNQDLMFVAAEPFTHEHLIFTLESQQTKGKVATLGVARVPLTSIERRVDDRTPVSHWFSFQNPNKEEERSSYKGRVHLRLCFDGGYHVMDEAAHVCSDFRPTARQLWKPPIGTVELGIIACKNLLPMKTIDGRGSTDAYAVAKYGPKWVRTRTVSESLDPKWNEQYTWKVYDPALSSALGYGSSVQEPVSVAALVSRRKEANGGDRAGREIRTCRSHARHPPRLQPTSLALNAPHQTSRSGPTGNSAEHCCQNRGRTLVEVGATAEAGDRALHVGTPTLRPSACERSWKNPTATILVHALLVLLVWFPDLIFPTLSFYVFAIGAWNYRFKSREPLPHFCPKISMVEAVDREELDEEFDTCRRCWGCSDARGESAGVGDVEGPTGDRDIRRDVFGGGGGAVFGAVEDGGDGGWVLLHEASHVQGQGAVTCFQFLQEAAFTF